MTREVWGLLVNRKGRYRHGIAPETERIHALRPGLRWPMGQNRRRRVLVSQSARGRAQVNHAATLPKEPARARIETRRQTSVHHHGLWIGLPYMSEGA